MHVLARNGCHGKGLYWQGLCSLSLSLAALPSVEFMCCRVYKVPQRAVRGSDDSLVGKILAVCT